MKTEHDLSKLKSRKNTYASKLSKPSRTKATTVAQYIDAAPQDARGNLRSLRALLKKLAPKAKEAIKWGSPVIEAERILFAYTAYKAHINFMPTQSSLEPFTKELEGFKTGKDTIQLPHAKPIPKALITKIASHRIKQMKAGDARWRN